MNDKGIIYNTLVKLFGANFATTLSGYLTVLFGAIYTTPELVHWIPEPYQGFLWNVSKYLAAAGFITMAHQAKSKNVTGGTTQQDTHGDPIPPENATLVEATKAATPST